MLRQVGITAVLLLFTLAPRTSAQDSAMPTLKGRPIVILLHGRNQAYRLRGELQQHWFDALENGVAKVTGGAPLLGHSDKRFVWYGDLFEYGARTDPRCRAAVVPLDERPKAEGQLFERLTGNDVVRTTQGLVDKGRRFRPLRSYISSFSDVELYIENDDVKCAVNVRLLDALVEARDAGRPIVLVAHSMGGLVSYTVLHKLALGHYSWGDSVIPPVRIERVVTLGTQIAVRGLPARLMDDDRHVSRFPVDSVPSWVNVKGRYDVIGFLARDNSQFISPPGSRVELRVLTDPNDRHAVSGYLKHPLTALAIASAWCGAFGPDVEPPAGCERVRHFVACDYDDLARLYYQRQHPGDSTRADRAFQDWIAGGRRVSLYQPAIGGSLAGEDAQTIPADVFSLRAVGAACEKEVPDVAESLTPYTPESGPILSTYLMIDMRPTRSSGELLAAAFSVEARTGLLRNTMLRVRFDLYSPSQGWSSEWYYRLLPRTAIFAGYGVIKRGSEPGGFAPYGVEFRLVDLATSEGEPLLAVLLDLRGAIGPRSRLANRDVGNLQRPSLGVGVRLMAF